MTIRDLIKELQTIRPDARVRMVFGLNGYGLPVADWKCGNVQTTREIFIPTDPNASPGCLSTAYGTDAPELPEVKP